VSTHYYRFTRCGAANRERSPMLERLLARADPPTAVIDWRGDAFRLIAPTITIPGVAAAALFAERGPVDAASVFIAAPVHYIAEMSSVRLPDDGILSLLHSEADALATDFNRVWDGAGVRLFAGRFTDLYCEFDQALNATTHDPEDVCDRHIENYLPTGSGSPRLRRLMSETEMWLFEHAVNRTRMSVSAPAVNGLWLWGGGPTVTALPAVQGWSAGDDPLFKAIAAGSELSRAAAASGVVVVTAQPGTDEWRGMESRWLSRSFADLRSARIDRVDLSAGNRCFSVRGRWNWRLWRRRRPWWKCFE
jgi:hypothetical protein